MKDLLTPTSIIRSKRKSISLIIENNGDFIVRVPIKTPEADIYKFIVQKQNWIIKKRTEQLQNSFKPLKVVEGEQISILGTIYNISIKEHCVVKVADKLICVPKTSSKEKLVNYLKRWAQKYIQQELTPIANMLNLKYESLTINSAKTRWGSCSGSNKLHFTYKLMLCPISVVKYIIVHELCHIKEKNHSKKFWSLVKAYYPDYKLCEKWLKDNRAIIDLI